MENEADRAQSKKEKMKGKGLKTALRTLLVTLLATAGMTTLFLAYKLYDQAESLTQISLAMLPFSLGMLFAVFLGLHGIASGLLASSFEEDPFSFIPHLSAPVAFLASLAFGSALIGRLALPEALFALLYYLSGFLIFRARCRKSSKKTCVLFAVVPAVILAGLVFLIRAFSNFGSTGSPLAGSIEHMENVARSVGGSIADVLLNLSEGLLNAILYRTVSSDALSGLTMEEFSALLHEMYEYTLTALLRVLPAFIVGAFNIAGYIAVSIGNRTSIFKRAGEVWRLRISGFGTALFLISAFMTALFISIDTAGVVGILLYSMRLIFLPAFFGIGVRTMIEFFRNKGSGRVVLTVVSVILAILSPFVFIPMIGVYGNFSAIMEEKRKQLGNDFMPKL